MANQDNPGQFPRENQEEISRKGGQSQGKENNPGNFANDRAKARKAGQEGGSQTGTNNG